MTTTVPSVPAQPATPGQPLRWAADRWLCKTRTVQGLHDGGDDERAALRRWADELDAAPEPAGPSLWEQDQAQRRAEATALHHAAAQLARGEVWADPFGQWGAEQAEAAGAQKQLMVDRLNDIAARLDAAPAVYALPPEPPETVTELWDRNGQRWERWETGDYVRWSHTAWPRRNCTWHELLVYGPLSTAPPAGTEADDATQP